MDDVNFVFLVSKIRYMMKYKSNELSFVGLIFTCPAFVEIYKSMTFMHRLFFNKNFGFITLYI
jgi:hypothetical protein